jgi:hypothetical protein
VAFEHFLRDKKISYLAIDEAKRPVEIDKNFDFLVFTESKAFMVDVKGKQIPYTGGSGFPWETWIHQKDLTGLKQWQDRLRPLFKCEVESLIAYVYWIKDESFAPHFGTRYKYSDKNYGMKAITLSNFEKHKKIRSGFASEEYVWQLPREQAENILKDINFFLC